MQILQKNFATRDHLVSFVKSLAHWAEGEPSHIQGGRLQADIKLSMIDPVRYGESRNFGEGQITRLSPYIHHGILSINEVRNHAISKSHQLDAITKFIQELGWRDFWQRILTQSPEWAWNDVEDYKTGFTAGDYADQLPEDMKRGDTGVACIDAFIGELVSTGYIHNHARMYLASYVVHFRRIKWQAGTRWFLTHLIDGDLASNNLSWQWVASTFSHKPYIFNLENVQKYFGTLVDTAPSANKILASTYEDLEAKLFPNLRPSR